ncbi:OLC1v1019047C1 [Oldenlandia corymbosa var. corymbosa]|uniref:OLC1v1019047C1 n=1 Tax=Oldenlandia corymbosa var. corymbosa TaxID=529605 RepID=A0AAV1EDH4_OLDCO|nr:OLC1v1019047C1 [Oldenlandia corymbosa var. corymbosa]
MALMEPASCEVYGNLCSHLAATLPDLSDENCKITFRKLLVNMCQEEFERREREKEEAEKGIAEDSVKSRNARWRRFLGNVRFIGELYKKRLLTERIMHECVKKLLCQYQNPDEEDIEALCTLMITVGEMIDHPKAREYIDSYFNVMDKLSNNMKLSSTVRCLLKGTIDLRNNKWQQRTFEGPKSIEEAQATRRRRQQYSSFRPRLPNMLASPSSQMGSSRSVLKLRGGDQGVWMEEKHILDDRSFVVPPTRRPLGDEATFSEPKKEWPKERLRDIAKDENEVALCIKELNNASFYPSMISLWVADSFERNDMERDLLTKLLIKLTESRYDIVISRDQLMKGFNTVLITLEDAIIDAPKAAQFLGHMFARVILENVISLYEIERLLYEGGEKPGCLVETGLAAEVLGTTLETIASQRGDSGLREFLSNSDVRLESFRPPGSNKSWRLSKFI